VMKLTLIHAADPAYPASLRERMGADAPETVHALGDLAVLARPKLALLCSIRCPGRLILRTYDLAHRLREGPFAVVGGFHTPMEQECLRVLLRGPAPVILCPARSIVRLRVPVEHRGPLEEGRLLVLSPFGEGDRRSTVDTAAFRNRFVAALADRLFVAHAAPGGKTERLCADALALGMPVFTFEDEANRTLLTLGASCAEPGIALGPMP
jgi:predicted Rossmann fold nucleotide-binding protein DprA/Smf involved in DNA uptake